MNERNAGRWLAVPAGGDSVTLLPMDGAGPDFFVKASDYDALRARVAELEERLDAMMPLFEEARDALPAITLGSAKLRGIRLDLADRMDDVGDPERWAARKSASSSPTTPLTDSWPT